MTLVMDGVRTLSAKPAATDLRTARPMRQAARVRSVQSRNFVTGFDGVRRPAASQPRQAIAQPAVLMTAPAATMSTPQPVWQLPSLRMPTIQWRRPALAFGLVATALIASGLTVNGLTASRSTTAQANVAPATAAPAAPVVAPTPQKSGLQQILDDFVAVNGDNFGIVVKDLKTGETAQINPDRKVLSASLYKMFVAQRIYQRIDIGQLDYGKAAGGGTGRNVEQCLTVMINISDNACGRALGAMLGWGAQNQALGLEGYHQTDLASPQQTSAGDMATMLDRLYGGTLLSPNSSERFLSLLKSQRVNNRLPAGLPNGTIIAHKTGDLDGVVHDAGIVYGPKTDYLVVVTSGPWQAPAGAAVKFADISGKLWNYFQK